MIIKFYVKQSILFLLFFVLLSCNENPETNVNKSFILDDLGKTFEPKSKIERIVSLAPNLTELLFTLKVGNKIVGNTKYCNYPDSAKSIEKVGDLLTVDAEKIVTLKPDIIFITVEGNSKFDYDKLKQLGFNVFVSNASGSPRTSRCSSTSRRSTRGARFARRWGAGPRCSPASRSRDSGTIR